MLEGTNCIVLDCETRQSAHDCRYCGQSEATHRGKFPQHCGRFASIGWEDHALLGLSIGCYFSYSDGLFHWFDQATLLATFAQLIAMQPLIVSFNGHQFDGPLLLACVDDPISSDGEPLTHLPQQWVALWERSYDLLRAIWQVAPARKFERGLNSLGAISVANGFGEKEMDGAMAPRLWAQGRYAEVLNYCQGDIEKTRLLFERIVETGQILRGDGLPVTLPRPSWKEQEHECQARVCPHASLPFCV